MAGIYPLFAEIPPVPPSSSAIDTSSAGARYPAERADSSLPSEECTVDLHTPAHDFLGAGDDGGGVAPRAALSTRAALGGGAGPPSTMAHDGLLETDRHGLAPSSVVDALQGRLRLTTGSVELREPIDRYSIAMRTTRSASVDDLHFDFEDGRAASVPGDHYDIPGQPSSLAPSHSALASEPVSLVTPGIATAGLRVESFRAVAGSTTAEQIARSSDATTMIVRPSPWISGGKRGRKFSLATEPCDSTSDGELYGRRAKRMPPEKAHVSFKFAGGAWGGATARASFPSGGSHPSSQAARLISLRPNFTQLQQRRQLLLSAIGSASPSEAAPGKDTAPGREIPTMTKEGTNDAARRTKKRPVVTWPSSRYAGVQFDRRRGRWKALTRVRPGGEEDAKRSVPLYSGDYDAEYVAAAASDSTCVEYGMKPRNGTSLSDQLEARRTRARGVRCRNVTEYLGVTSSIVAAGQEKKKMFKVMWKYLPQFGSSVESISVEFETAKLAAAVYDAVRVRVGLLAQNFSTASEQEVALEALASKIRLLPPGDPEVAILRSIISQHGAEPEPEVECAEDHDSESKSRASAAAPSES